MVSGKSPDELPPGWKEHVKVSNGRKIKYYTNEVMGLKFYSKKRVIHFVNTKDVCQDTSQSVNEHDQKSSCFKSEASSSQVLVEKNASLEWLPRGWIIESRTRKSGSIAGSVYKTYIDPSTGCKFYSKPQVIQYLERVNCNAAPEKQKKEVSGDNSSKQDAPQHFESMKDKSQISGKEGIGMGKPSMEIVCCEVSNNSSKQGTPQHCESVKGNSRISGKEENGMGKPSLEIVSSVVNESNVLDELPPGWIKENRARKRGMKTDPYYIDPVSGYEFRSKKDALRYLEFGDISRCAITPKKRDRSDLKLVEYDVSEQKQPEAEWSKEIPSSNTSADAKVTPSTVDPSEDLQICSELSNCARSADSSQPKNEGSKLDAKDDDNGAVSNTTTAIFHEQKYPEDYLDTKTQIQLKKSKKRKPLSMPARSSKRLSGQEPEILPNLGLSERALRAAVRKPGQPLAYISPSLAQNSASNGVPQQFDTQLQREVIADFTSPCIVASLETEKQNIEKLPQDQVVKEQAVGQVNDRREEEDNLRSQDSHLWYPFGDSFSDPCYEFAFKTLTGEIPLEDTLAFPACFQQQAVPSFTQRDATFGLSEINTPAYFQNDVPFHFDSVQQNISADQVTPKSTIPPGNINMPSCSSFGSQKPSLDTRSKDYETKVNS